MAAVDSKLRFLQAGRDILAAGGELGVNAVAKKTGLNKVLLYRYFEDWNGYLSCLADELNLWKDIRIEFLSGLEAGLWNDAASAASWVLRTYQGRLRADEVLLTIMATERSRSSPLRRRIDDEQEAEGTLILQALFRRWPEVPRESALAISAVMTAGLNHLALRARVSPLFNSLDITQEDTWEILMREIEMLLRRLLG